MKTFWFTLYEEVLGYFADPLELVATVLIMFIVLLVMLRS